MLGIISLLGGWRATVFAMLWIVMSVIVIFQNAYDLHQKAAWAKEREEAAKEAVRAASRYKEAENRHIQEMALLGEQHEQERTAALAMEADVVSSLRAGTVRMRHAWEACEQRGVVSSSSPAASKRDAPSPDRAALAGAIVRAGRDADDQIKACQEVIRAYQE